ncbi:MAG: tetratricopeptide repeat protein [Bacteroidia bacterium]
MSAKKTQVIIVVGALVLFVLLFIAPKIAPPHNEDDGHGHSTPAMAVNENANLDVYVNMALKNLEPSNKGRVEALIAAKKHDSVAVFWDKMKRPDLASVYVEQQARLSNKAADWFKAGNRYYYSIQFTQDKTEAPLLYQCAIRCFSKGLKLEPNNADAKIMLASCYVEGTGNPMEGISMMKEIEKTDSNNVKLQLSFAFFSVKSGQLDKAITRFNKVLAIDSNYIEAYLHLADAYEQQGNTEKTIEVLEKYRSKTTDVTAKVEIEKYIQQLKKMTK